MIVLYFSLLSTLLTLGHKAHSCSIHNYNSKSVLPMSLNLQLPEFSSQARSTILCVSRKVSSVLGTIDQSGTSSYCLPLTISFSLSVRVAVRTLNRLPAALDPVHHCHCDLRSSGIYELVCGDNNC